MQVQLSFQASPYTEVFVALGGNSALDGKSVHEALNESISLLDSGEMTLRSRSRMYSTPCFPAGAGPDFVNAAAVFRTSLPPEAVLRRLHEVESVFGRERKVRWSERTLDLDLLGYGDAVAPDEPTFRRWADLPLERQTREAPDRLILPHPRMQDRAFVLVPMAEIAPDWRHPVFGLTVAEMAAAIPAEERAQIAPL